VKVPLLAAVPPVVVTEIFPVVAAAGTLALISVSLTEITVLVAAAPKATLFACLSPVPTMSMRSPGAPLVGENDAIVGVTSKEIVLVALPRAVFTTSGPVGAPLGTTALTCVSLTVVVDVEGAPPNVIELTLAKPVPLIVTVAPCLPCAVNVVIVGPLAA